MFFALSRQQTDLQSTVRAFMNKRVSESETRRLMQTSEGYDRDVWKALAGDIGVGGLGADFVDVAVVQEELGRSLYSGPFLSGCVMATQLLNATAAEDPSRALLRSIASGETTVAVAVGGERGLFTVDDIAVSATDGVLAGVSAYVVDGAGADQLLVLAREAGELAVFVVDPTAPGVQRTASTTMDQTRPQATISLDGVRGQRLSWAAQDGAAIAVSRMLLLTQVAITAEQVGGAQQCLDIVVSYLGTREQFGRPIGSFQAVKHACADVVLGIESARAAAYYAAWVAGNRPEELAQAAALAKAVASEAYLSAAENAIQLQGGIGFVWDNPAHLYFKRAKSDQLLFGDPSSQRELLAESILDAC